MTKVNFIKRSLMLCTLVCSSTLSAFEHNSHQGKPFDFHGFVAQGVIQAQDSNYINDDGEVSPRLTEVGINGSWRIKPSLMAAGQVTYLNAGNRYEEGDRVDYLFLKWTALSQLNWNLDFYLGRYKNQHWLYSATNDVPMTRPTIVLPQSVYVDGSRDISVGSDGVLMKLSHFSDIGELEFNWSYGSSSITDERVKGFISFDAQGDGEQEFVHQASLYWQPEFSNFRWGISYLDTDFEYSSARGEVYFNAELSTQRYFSSLYYSGEFWEFSSEMFLDRSEVSGLFAPVFFSRNYSIGGYLQARYHVNDDLIVTIRQDKYFRDKDDKDGSELLNRGILSTPSYLAFQHDFTFGLSYQIAPNWRVMAEHHWVEGTARTLPTIIPRLDRNKEKYWELWAIQLMYWF